MYVFKKSILVLHGIHILGKDELLIPTGVAKFLPVSCTKLSSEEEEDVRRKKLFVLSPPILSHYSILRFNNFL